MRRPFLLFISMFVGCSVFTQNMDVQATGAMRTALHDGKASAVIRMDSLAAPGFFGLGPLEDLRGEVLLWNGQAHVAMVNNTGCIQVTTDNSAGAPFFVAQQVRRWQRTEIPDSVTTLPKLDAFLTAHLGDAPPFAFVLEGRFDTVRVHVLNVPEGIAVHSREEAHRYDGRFTAAQRSMTVLGFFSTRHHGIFTHHDANTHLHAISAERDWMGHVEELRFDPKAVLLTIAAP